MSFMILLFLAPISAHLELKLRRQKMDVKVVNMYRDIKSATMVVSGIIGAVIGVFLERSVFWIKDLEHATTYGYGMFFSLTVTLMASAVNYFVFEYLRKHYTNVKELLENQIDWMLKGVIPLSAFIAIVMHELNFSYSPNNPTLISISICTGLGVMVLEHVLQATIIFHSNQRAAPA